MSGEEEEPIFCCFSMQLQASPPLETERLAIMVGNNWFSFGTVAKSTLEQFIHDAWSMDYRNYIAPESMDGEERFLAFLQTVVHVIGVRTFSRDARKCSQHWYLKQVSTPWLEASLYFPEGVQPRGFQKVRNVRIDYKCEEHDIDVRFEIWCDMSKSISLSLNAKREPYAIC